MYCISAIFAYLAAAQATSCAAADQDASQAAQGQDGQGHQPAYMTYKFQPSSSVISGAKISATERESEI